MTKTPTKPHEILQQIKYRLAIGALTYEQARDFSVEPLRKLNEELAKASKQLGMRPTKVTFISYMR